MKLSTEEHPGGNGGSRTNSKWLLAYILNWTIKFNTCVLISEAVVQQKSETKQINSD